MKKTLLSLFLLLPFIVCAQYFPLVKDGGIWRQIDSHFPIMPGDYWLLYKYQYQIKGDTTINGVDYKKLYSMNYDSLLVEDVEFFGSIREDSLKRVYYLDKNTVNSPLGNNNDSTEILLYDFSLNIGDTIYMPAIYSEDSMQIVESIDSMLIEGQWRKRINFQQTINSISKRTWVEGIGNLKGLFFPFLFEFENYWILTCYEDNSIFWTNPEMTQNGISCFGVGIEDNTNNSSLSLDIYPNPCTNYIEFSFNKLQNQDFTITIFNSLGKIVMEELIYAVQESFKLNTNSFNSGLYYYRISGNAKGVGGGRFIKL